MVDTHRWSDLIPPHNALTFAAMWDPKDGMVTFSGVHLLDSDLAPHSEPTYHQPPLRRPRFHRTYQDYAPRDAVDTQSQVLTIDLLANALMGNTPNTDVFAAIHERDRLRARARGTVTFAALDDGGSVTDPFLRRQINLHHQYNGSDDSIDLDEADHEEDVPLATGRRVDPHPVQDKMKAIGNYLLAAARTPLDGILFGARSQNPHAKDGSASDEVGQDSGFFEEVPLTATAGSYYSAPLLVNLNLKSTFSMTTTSTTNYVDVDCPSICPSGHHHPNECCDTSEVWSTLQDLYHSEESRDGYVPTSSPCGLPIAHTHIRRRLRKQRSRAGLPLPPLPLDSPAKPEDVLAREEYNHEVPLTPSTPSAYSQPSVPPSPQPAFTPPCRPLPPIPPILKRQKSFAKAKKVIMNTLTKCQSRRDEDDFTGWVCVDVTKKVTQRVLH